MMKITPYGGVEEIGGNKILVETSRSRLMLDFGISYKQKGKFFEEYLAVRSQSALHDYLELGLLPEIEGIYRKDAFRPPDNGEDLGRSEDLWPRELLSYGGYKEDRGEPFLDGLLISHGHDDHHALSAFLGPVPTYCSAGTAALMEVGQRIGNYHGYEGELTYLQKRSVGQYKGGFFPGAKKTVKGEKVERPFNTFDGSRSFRLGKEGEIEVRAVPVGHSVPGAVAYFIEAEGESLLYTGDIRFHGRYASKEEVLERLASLDPDLLLIEGTRIDDAAKDDEEGVRVDLEEEIAGTSGLAMIGFRWKDVERFQTVREAAINCGRTLVISARLAYLLHRLGYDVEGMEDVEVFLERRRSMLYSPGDYTRNKYKAGYSTEWERGEIKESDIKHLSDGVDALTLRKNPREFVLQLTYWGFNNLLDIQPPPGSIYIRASTEPFNAEMELSEERLGNWLAHFGINEPDGRPRYIHASGHASGPELLELTRAIDPGTVIPIHSESPEIYAKEIRRSRVLLPRRGRTIESDALL